MRKFKLLIVIVISFQVNFILAQSDAILNKWERAVINVHSIVADTAYMDFKLKQFRLLDSLHHAGLISQEQLAYERNEIFSSKQSTGTVVLMENQNAFYFLTASHVLLARLPQYVYHSDDNTIEKTEVNFIPNELRVIPRAGNFSDTIHTIKQIHINAYQDLTGHITHWIRADIALWSISSLIPEFDKELKNEKYKPITFDDIAWDEQIKVGREVFAIGFPGAVSNLDEEPVRQMNGNRFNHPVSSLPMTSWGRVGMSHPESVLTYVDISVYPGNSGGPIVDASTGKLLGIVSAQKSERVLLGNEITNYRHRIPFAVVVNWRGIDGVVDLHNTEASSRNSRD